MMEVDSDASFASPPPAKGKTAAGATAKGKAKAPAKGKKKALVSCPPHMDRAVRRATG